jgi:pimeloyl-ACP methyl ester carboxylesterase
VAGAVRRRFVTRPPLPLVPSGAARVATLLALLVLSALIVARPAPAATSAPATAGCANVTQPGIIAGTTPILFVHGIDSDPTAWTAGTVSGTSVAPLAYVDGALGTRVTGYTFDWSGYSGFRSGSTLSWVTGPPAPGPGELLAQAIKCVAGKAGRKVIIVAHSMGGLLAEYASSVGSVSGEIAAVFTLGTPYQGSQLDSAATGALGWLTQAIGGYCSGASGKQHVKEPSGGVSALCRLVSQRDDPGMQGMRTGLARGQGWHALSWPGVFPVFPLAASIQATSWQPLPLPGLQLTFADFGDFVVGTSSELSGGTTPTVSCTVPITGSPDLATLLGAVTASSCFHTNEPDNKTLLDTIISTITEHHLLPTAATSGSHVDWRNTSYVTTCGGEAQQPFTVTVRDGHATYAPSSQSAYDIRVTAIAQGHLLGGASDVTAVLLTCTPTPSNFFTTEIHVFTADNKPLTTVQQPPDLIPGGYMPYFSGNPFLISNGLLTTGAGYHPSCHACGVVPYLLTWELNGNNLVLHKATSLGAQSSQPAAAAACPNSAQLLAAWNAAPTALRDSWIAVQVAGFTAISCWNSWVVAVPVSPSPGNGNVVFSQTGNLHLITTAELNQQFAQEVCSSPNAPPSWKEPPLISCS